MRLSSLLVVFFSLFIALLLFIAPIPIWLTDIWPIWLIPVISYWIMALPHRIGLAVAWVSGLVLDVLMNSLMGEHALALLIITAVMLKLHRRFSFFTIWQQIIMQMFLTAVYLTVLALIQKVIGQPVSNRLYWWPIVTTGFVWPMVASILRGYRQRYRMT